VKGSAEVVMHQALGGRQPSCGDARWPGSWSPVLLVTAQTNAATHAVATQACMMDGSKPSRQDCACE
jgi:hypothetical protein